MHPHWQIVLSFFFPLIDVVLSPLIDIYPRRSHGMRRMSTASSLAIVAVAVVVVVVAVTTLSYFSIKGTNADLEFVELR